MSNEKKGLPGAAVVVATFIGGMTGVVSGILLAPQSGKKTREQIRESYDEGVKKTNEFVKRMEERIPEITSKVRESQEKVKGEVLQFRKEAEEKLDQTVEKGKTYAEDIKKKATSTIEEGKKKLKKEKEKPSSE